MFAAAMISRGGRFRIGHDQKLRKAIEDAVGELENLRSLAESYVKRPITTNVPEVGLSPQAPLSNSNFLFLIPNPFPGCKLVPNHL